MATMTRTDIHRPSAPEFDPEGYDFFGVFDLATGAADWVGPTPASTVSPLVEQGWSFSGAPHGSGQCSHCGARIRYAALMGHAETKTLLYIGETCLDNRFSLTAGEFDALRKNSALNRERNNLTARRNEFLADHPDLVWASYAHNIGCSGEERVWDEDYQEWTRKRNTAWIERTRNGKHISTLTDMWYRFSRYGDMSEKAYGYLQQILGWLDEAEQRLVERERATEALKNSGVEAPKGRQAVEVEVVGIKFYDNDFGGTWKMTVKSDEGWKAWGSVPAAIDQVEKGQRVRFTATFTETEDALFARFTRPAKAEIL
jgi:hypothetical protein